jgi:hypothetical protein
MDSTGGVTLNLKQTIIEVLKSILPITIVILILQFTMVELPRETFINFIFGVLMAIVGYFLFLIGVNNSLLPVGNLVGMALLKKSKLWLIIFFGIVIGFAITIAEPAVLVLANQIDILSKGEIAKNLLIAVISIGVGIFLGLAMLRVVFGISLNKLLIVSYILVLIMSMFASPEFLGIAYDAGGVTIGILAVPFILAMGVGMSSVKGIRRSSYDNFGFIALASVGPILAVLLLGVLIK